VCAGGGVRRRWCAQAVVCAGGAAGGGVPQAVVFTHAWSPLYVCSAEGMRAAARMVACSSMVVGGVFVGV
jgi:hypothetical protein